MNEAIPVVDVLGGSRVDNDGGFMGGEGLWAVIILAIIFGWGGGFGNRNAQGGSETRSAVSEGFALNGLENGIRGVQQGLCDGFYAVNTSLLNGFSGVDNAVCTLGYQTQQGFNALGSQLASCCCDTQRSIDGVKFQMATDTCAVQTTIRDTTRDIIDNQNANYRGIMDFMVQSKIDSLQAENQALKFQASQASQNAYIAANQEAQTAELIRRLGRDCPVPAYVVPNPNCCYGNQAGLGFGGCNSGCC